MNTKDIHCRILITKSISKEVPKPSKQVPHREVRNTFIPIHAERVKSLNYVHFALVIGRWGIKARINVLTGLWDIKRLKIGQKIWRLVWDIRQDISLEIPFSTIEQKPQFFMLFLLDNATTASRKTIPTFITGRFGTRTNVCHNKASEATLEVKSRRQSFDDYSYRSLHSLRLKNVPDVFKARYSIYLHI